MNDNKHYNRIESLRSLMRSRGWDAVILTGSDPHCSEYPAERWKQVRWLTGFTGEAGDVVVTLDHAGLWTDTRYFIQANAQLEGTGAVLHKTRVPEQVLIPEWLDKEFPGEAVIAVDGLCQSESAIAALPSRFTIVSVPDLMSTLWTDRPGIPQTPIECVFTGESRPEKIEWLRGILAERDLDAILLSSLDDIAWLLNVRASDIEYNPLVISYLLVGRDCVRWYVLKEDVEDPYTETTFATLREEGVELLPYSEIELDLDAFEGRLAVDSGSFNYHLSRALSCSVVRIPSPVQPRKAVRNPYEIQSLRECLVRDGLAMEKFIYWVEKSVAADRRITEWDAAVKLRDLRAEIEDFRGESFETISAYGPGAALPHYVTPRENAPVLEPHGLYLCDSGGQYLSGTTDITRTIPLGDCTPLEIEDYTLVLKCHIDLAMAVYPEGTPGCRLDILAREPLWQFRRNFGHGTGHGVGFFLGVHEGPHEFRQNFNSVPFLHGMTVTDEPGIYREGMHGVRHESQLLCVDDCENEFGRWMRFENMTVCHIDTSAVDVNLLTSDERRYLNAYNARVYDTLADLLPAEIAQWLRAKTNPI